MTPTSKTIPSHSRLRAALLVPYTFTFQLATGCAEMTVDTDAAGAARAPTVGHGQAQLAAWAMPDAVESSKIKPSYSVSDSGLVVVDNVTGLAWQRAARTEFAANDCSARDGCNWEEANAYCDKLSLGEHDDFRLPTKIELESIVDDTEYCPTIDPEAFPEADDDIFWTESTLAGSTSRAWIVSFGNGVTFAASTDETLLVRCVRTERSGSTPSGLRYTVDSAATPGTVTDAHTGLIWQQSMDTAEHDLEGAKTYCASLGAHWRLPTKKELLTLVDPTVAPRGTRQEHAVPQPHPFNAARTARAPG